MQLSGNWPHSVQWWLSGGILEESLGRGHVYVEAFQI